MWSGEFLWTTKAPNGNGKGVASNDGVERLGLKVKEARLV